MSDISTELPILRLITDHLDRQADERPDQDFLVQGDTRLTYAQTKALVDRTAKALLAAGIERGDRVAMLSTPRSEFYVHHLAVTSVGAIWVGLNPKYTAGELEHIVGDAEPTLLFGFGELLGDDLLPSLSGLLDTHPSIRELVLFDDGTPERGVDWEAFLASGDAIDDEALAERRAAIDPMDAAYLVYTSGSTGRPKGALITHYSSNFCNVIGVERKALTDRAIICNLPINHVGAIGDICGRTMTGGGTLYFQEAFSPVDMMELIQSERLNTIGGVPTMLQMCLAHPDIDAYDLTSIDLIAWGGAGMPADLLQDLMAKTECTRSTMGYGMTETTGGVTYSGLHDSIDLLTTTIGTPDHRQPLRIWHPDGREAERDEAGEIQVKGDYVLAGYWRQPEATAAAFTDDGWFCTGDLAVHRQDGYVQIVGRMSEMYKSGGYNVYPREVELALEAHPGVSMAAVVSVPDPTFQEVGVAYVMGLMDVDADELRAFARERLANYKLPKEIHQLSKLPMLPIGKVDKKALAARHSDPAEPTGG